MKIIAITTPTFFVEEDQIITALFEEGLDILHLRKPEIPAMYSERLLTLIPQKYHKRIVVHDHFYLQEEFGLMGIHLNGRNPHEPHDYAGHVSCSCHNLEEVKQRKHFYDYVMLFPTYPCNTSKGPMEGYTFEELKAAEKSHIIDSHVMALGGIDETNIKQTKKLGFGGVVLMSTLWNKFDVHTNSDYRGIIEHFKKLKDLID